MRKTRSDCRVGTFEKKNGLSPGTVKSQKHRPQYSTDKPEMINERANPPAMLGRIV